MSSAASRRRCRCISGWSPPQTSSKATMMFIGSNVSSEAGCEESPALPRLTPEMLLAAYAAGVFPMAETADDPELFWVDPRQRGILPLDQFHVPHKLRRVVRRGSF